MQRVTGLFNPMNDGNEESKVHVDCDIIVADNTTIQGQNEVEYYSEFLDVDEQVQTLGNCKRQGDVDFSESMEREARIKDAQIIVTDFNGNQRLK